MAGCVLVYNDKQWRAFLAALGARRFDDDLRFSTHGARAKHIGEVYGYLAGVLCDAHHRWWLDLFARADIPAARMYSIDDILDDEHLRAIGYFRAEQHPTEGEITALSVPTEWSESVPEPPQHAPSLGEHTREVLAELGYFEGEIAALIESGAVSSGGR